MDLEWLFGSVGYIVVLLCLLDEGSITRYDIFISFFNKVHYCLKYSEWFQSYWILSSPSNLLRLSSESNWTEKLKMAGKPPKFQNIGLQSESDRN